MKKQMIALFIAVTSGGLLATDAHAVPIDVALQSNGGTASAISSGTYMGDTQFPWEAIDGNPATGWSSSWDMPAWLKVEFNNAYTIEAIGILWGTHVHDYYVSLSMDDSTWQTVLGPAVSTNVEGGGPLVYEYSNITPTLARFIRVDITSTSAPGGHIFQSSIQDLEAFAVPEPGTATLIGIALLVFTWKERNRER